MSQENPILSPQSPGNSSQSPVGNPALPQTQVSHHDDHVSGTPSPQVPRGRRERGAAPLPDRRPLAQLVTPTAATRYKKLFSSDAPVLALAANESFLFLSRRLLHTLRRNQTQTFGEVIHAEDYQGLLQELTRIHKALIELRADNAGSSVAQKIDALEEKIILFSRLRHIQRATPSELQNYAMHFYFTLRFTPEVANYFVALWDFSHPTPNGSLHHLHSLGSWIERLNLQLSRGAALLHSTPASHTRTLCPLIDDQLMNVARFRDVLIQLESRRVSFIAQYHRPLAEEINGLLQERELGRFVFQADMNLEQFEENLQAVLTKIWREYETYRNKLTRANDYTSEVPLTDAMAHILGLKKKLEELRSRVAHNQGIFFEGIRKIYDAYFRAIHTQGMKTRWVLEDISVTNEALYFAHPVDESLVELAELHNDEELQAEAEQLFKESESKKRKVDSPSFARQQGMYAANPQEEAARKLEQQRITFIRIRGEIKSGLVNLRENPQLTAADIDNFINEKLEELDALHEAIEDVPARDAVGKFMDVIRTKKVADYSSAQEKVSAYLNFISPPVVPQQTGLGY